MASETRRLNVVVASVGGMPLIERCVEALDKQTGSVDVNVVIADRCGDTVIKPLKERFKGITVIEAPALATVPELRAMAMADCTEGPVAVIEDHCITPPAWAEAMVKALKGGREVVAGPIANITDRSAIDRAAFYCEYSSFMAPAADGPADMVPGNNVAYSEAVFDKYRDLFASGAWDTIVHERMAADGVELYMTGDAVIGHCLSPGLFGFCIEKYHFARSFAGKRFELGSTGKRLFFAAASVALPFVLFIRILSDLRAKGVSSGEVFSVSVPMVIFLLFWALGEFTGYMLGPGTSSEKVR